MSDRIILQIAPLFGCRDLNGSIDSYRDLLGFALRFRREDEYAIVTRGDVDIHLETRQGPFSPASCCVMVRGLDDFYDEMSAAGAIVMAAPAATPDGVRQFVVEDDDGNRLILIEE